MNTTNTPGPGACAAPARDADERDPQILAQYRALRERRAVLTAAVREVLAEQPTPRLVRVVAHRLANEIHLIAEDIIRDKDSTEDRS